MLSTANCRQRHFNKFLKHGAINGIIIWTIFLEFNEKGRAVSILHPTVGLCLKRDAIWLLHALTCIGTASFRAFPTTKFLRADHQNFSYFFLLFHSVSIFVACAAEYIKRYEFCFDVCCFWSAYLTWVCLMKITSCCFHQWICSKLVKC